MTEYPWYGWTEGTDLQQGDLIRDCPLAQLSESVETLRTKYDVVILSQSCDLANDKLKLAQVCPYWTLDELSAKTEFFRGKRGREELRRGNLPGYHLLNQYELPESKSDFLVVVFRLQFAVKFETMSSLANAQSPRLRLLPPYREHLAQTLARFYMRVGLPIDIPAF